MPRTVWQNVPFLTVNASLSGSVRHFSLAVAQSAARTRLSYQ